MRPWLKAGLIGAAIMVMLSLLSLVPLLSCLTFPLQFLAYLGVGGLAAAYLLPRRETGPAAGQGALAGLIAGLASGVVSLILTPVSLATQGGASAIINQLPPDMLQQFEQAGVDPSQIFNTGTITGVTGLCCLPTGLIVGAILGALGGLIYASIRPE